MNCENLMIGDWVIHNNATPMQVSVVKQDCFACSQPYLYDYNNEFYPIPITTEILEANGFEKIPVYEDPFWDSDIVGYDWRVNDHDYPLQLCTFFKGNKICKVFGGVRIYYVHELQHALRLCGLNEIADNFKVE